MRTNGEAAKRAGPPKRVRSRDNVWQQHVLYTRHFVFQHQLALFQPLQLDLIEWSRFLKPSDNVVKIPVFLHQLREPFLKTLGIR